MNMSRIHPRGGNTCHIHTLSGNAAAAMIYEYLRSNISVFYRQHTKLCHKPLILTKIHI